MNYKVGKKVVLVYHRIDNAVEDYNRITVNEVNFKNQMRFLKEKFKILSLDEFLTYEGAEDVIAITFDDGFADFYTKALPILEQFQIPATIFITTGKIDSPEELWTTEILRLIYLNDSGCEEICVDLYGRQVYLSLLSMDQRTQTYRSIRQFLMQLSGREKEKVLCSLRKQLNMTEVGRSPYQMLTLDQCRCLSKHPLVTIGAHTVNHVSLGKVEDAVLEYEIKESIKRLKMIVEEEITYFAYPFGGKGDYSQYAIELLKKYGIKAAFTVNNDCYQEQIYDKYEIPRVYVGNWEKDQFQNKIENLLSSKGELHNDVEKENGFYIGRLEDDKLLWNSNAQIIIWGTGIRGKRIKEKLLRAGQRDRIIAFGDNNPTLWKKKIDGIEILPMKEVKWKDAIVVVNNSHDMKIYKQLQMAGVEKIHWII